jgi:hypothetical protein
MNKENVPFHSVIEYYSFFEKNEIPPFEAT